jgi:aminopeptidase N
MRLVVAVVVAVVMVAAVVRGIEGEVVAVPAGCVVNVTHPYRLPQSVAPSQYSLALEPDLMHDMLYANVSIDLAVRQSTSCIVLHANGLTIHHAQLTLSSSSMQRRVAQSIQYDHDKQMAILVFDTAIAAGSTGTLDMRYQAPINTHNATGFFKSRGRLVQQQQQQQQQQQSAYGFMWATQFEGPYARMAYPCFDEPAFKARFSASISVPSNQNLTCLFNTPLLGVSNVSSSSSSFAGSPAMSRFEFALTPFPISSYLVAFSIGQFGYVQQTSNGVDYRIYAPLGHVCSCHAMPCQVNVLHAACPVHQCNCLLIARMQEAWGKYSLAITIQIIEYFGELWNFTYPLPKLDQIAVPAIVMDGMENMGLVTYW